MKRLAALLVGLAAASALQAQEPMCATGERTNEILAYLQERGEHQPAERARLLAAATPTLRDGTFFMHASDNNVAVNGRADDLIGQTLEFQPVDATHYTLRHVPYAYVDPPAEPFRVFTPMNVHYVKYDLTSTSLTLFGSAVSSLYLSAFNSIHTKPPSDPTGLQVDDLHAFVQKDPLLSPLFITNNHPGGLAYPTMYVQERDSSLIVTWRSDGGSAIFGYDVQARLFSDGRIQYSYKSARSMRWGAPMISAGLTNVRASLILAYADQFNEIATPTNALLKPMVDFTAVEVSRLNDSDMLRVQLKLAGTIDPSKLASNEFLRYIIVFGQTGSAFFDIRPDGTTQTAPIGSSFIQNDNTASYAGDMLTFYVQQSTLPITTGNVPFTAFARIGSSKTFDTVSTTVPLTAAPHTFVTDLNATGDGTSLELPIGDPFTLPILSPQAAWDAIKAHYPLTDNDIDGIAVYQTFYTDIIFYAGAYSASGNPQVDGVATASTTYGTSAAKRANVMHMNTVGYGWNATDQGSSHVIMHEFGHRWLYFLRIKEGDAVTSSLNPVSAHPAQYVNTPAAFRVFNDYDASVMGGGDFIPNADGTFHVRAANYGYSWTDLYLMGLAEPSEVPPWFYVSGSNPALGPEYYPPDNINVSGTRVDVNVQQIIDALGVRKPDMAGSPKSFRVLFVLVTDDGVEATPDQMASMKKIRGLLETNFHTATGQRAEVHTDYGIPLPRRRGVGH